SLLRKATAVTQKSLALWLLIRSRRTSASPTYAIGFPVSGSEPVRTYTPDCPISSRSSSASNSVLGAATAFPLQFEISAVRRRFGSPWGRNSLLVAEG